MEAAGVPESGTGQTHRPKPGADLKREAACGLLRPRGFKSLSRRQDPNHNA